ncbi:MAG TPA: hypothetical protein VIV34_11970 [Pseudolabrys sp.]
MRCGTIDASFRSYLVLAGCELREIEMNGLIYLVGLIVVIMAILSFLGLR